MVGNMSATAVSRTVETWRQWTGRVLNGKYRLGQYLDGSNHSAVFLTEYGRGEDRRKAAVKLIPAVPGEEGRLSRWRWIKDYGILICFASSIRDNANWKIPGCCTL